MNDAEMLRRGAEDWACREQDLNLASVHLARYAANLRNLVKLAISRLDFQDFLLEVPPYREILDRVMEDERHLLPADFRMSTPPRLKAA